RRQRRLAAGRAGAGKAAGRCRFHRAAVRRSAPFPHRIRVRGRNTASAAAGRLRPRRGTCDDKSSEGNSMKIAILDDYQNVALRMEDWSALARGAEITVFNDHVSAIGDVVARLLLANSLGAVARENRRTGYAWSI